MNLLCVFSPPLWKRGSLNKKGRFVLMEYWAHIRESDKEKQTLESHLKGVAELAGKFAEKIGLKEYGELIGLLHDVGKYSDEFQNYLKSAQGLIDPDEDDYVNALGLKGKIDHSTSGAIKIFESFSNNDKEKLIAQILSTCIASHHSGLNDCISSDSKDVFSERMKKSDRKTNYKEASGRIEIQIKKRVQEILSDPQLSEGIINVLNKVHDQDECSKTTTWFKQGLLIKLLFSCLIDADRLDTADFEEPHLKELRNNGDYQSWDVLINRLDKRIQEFENKNKVDQIRKDVSEHCLKFAGNKKGIYSLTVPTGGGKTLSSLRFALNHAEKHELNRIIYVIPYTSIIDQNADEVRKMLEDKDDNGNYFNNVVLEHHSNLTPEEETFKQKILFQDWDAPIVFTTNVQLMETLFGFGTRNARRMHQLAKSVLIFDEIQTIPIRCVHMFNNAINFLVKNCGSTVVLCTATQPLLNNVDKKLGALRLSEEQEIMPDVEKLFSDLKRVEVIDSRQAGGWSSVSVSDLMIEQLEKSGSVLSILNTRKAAQELFNACKDKTNVDIFHLSTNMCPAHRMKVLEEIKKHLEPGNLKEIICISTQLIEAGVDVDFGSVIRSVAGLDSIAQAAGRCNRNGRRTIGNVFIINPDFEKLDMLKDIRSGKEVAERILDEYKKEPALFSSSLLSPKALDQFFKYYFFNRADEMKYIVKANSIIGHDDTLLSLLSLNKTVIDEYKRINKSAPTVYFRQSFMTAAKLFQAIDSSTRGIIVSYGEGQKVIAELCASPDVEKEYRLLKQAQRYSVNVYPHELKKLLEKGAIFEVQEGSGIYYLNEQFYSATFGMSMESVSGMSFLDA
jgi:CRISPR-associated endonuclease/helicase Cas3